MLDHLTLPCKHSRGEGGCAHNARFHALRDADSCQVRNCYCIGSAPHFRISTGKHCGIRLPRLVADLALLNRFSYQMLLVTQKSRYSDRAPPTGPWKQVWCLDGSDPSPAWSGIRQQCLKSLPSSECRKRPSNGALFFTGQSSVQPSAAGTPSRPCRASRAAACGWWCHRRDNRR